MSTLYDVRRRLADLIIQAGIGWNEGNVLILRQTDLFNDIATAMATAEQNAVLHIAASGGTSTEDDDLEMDRTFLLTIIVSPQLVEGSRPEEELWEDLVDLVHDLKLNASDPYLYRFLYKSDEDIDIQLDDGTAYMGRQTTFRKHLSIKRKIKKPNEP